jgi:hypothetical protein
LSIAGVKVFEWTPTTAVIVGDTTVGGDQEITGNQTVSGTQTVVKTQTLKDGGDIASATALTLGDGNFFNITGTTPTTSIGTKGVGTVIKLRANAAWPVTHHATNLILLTGASITSSAGDMMEFEEYGAGTWRMTAYHRASGAPLATRTPTFQILTSGTDATYTKPAGASYLRVRMVGGGGGGGGSTVNGAAGGATAFNSITVLGGSGANAVSGLNATAGGAGGTGGSGTASRIPGAHGGAGIPAVNGTSIGVGGYGGSSLFGGGGTPGVGGAAATDAIVNTGSGGGGNTFDGTHGGSGGGGAGEYAEFVIGTPAATYTYSIGAGGAGGSSGGGNGASGRIEVWEY